MSSMEKEVQEKLQSVGWDEACKIMDAYLYNDVCHSSEENREKKAFNQLKAIRLRYFMPIREIGNLLSNQ